MLDLAYTALLDFLARIRKSPVRIETVEPRFVPVKGSETKLTEGATRGPLDREAKEAPKEDNEK
jgi:hypothetical protein